MELKKFFCIDYLPFKVTPLYRRISVIRGAKIWRQKAVKIQFLIKKQRFSSHSFRRVTTFFLLKISCQVKNRLKKRGGSSN